MIAASACSRKRPWMRVRIASMRVPVIAVVGPTASGKSKLAVELALSFDGEVISADSRQVYRGLDLGTGKITKPETLGIPHHLLSFISPQEQFSVAEYVPRAEDAIVDISSRGKVPIVCGGSGQYVDALLRDGQLPEVPPDEKIRAELDQHSAPELFAMLQELDPERAETIDPDNKRRLVRAIEIVRVTGKPVPSLVKAKVREPFDVLWIGIETDPEELRQRIKERLEQRLGRGLVAEVRRLHDHGLSWERMDELGLEYRYAALFLRGKLREDEFREQLQAAIGQYARRQRTWWRKHDDIHWISGDAEEAVELVNKFLATPR